MCVRARVILSAHDFFTHANTCVNDTVRFSQEFGHPDLCPLKCSSFQLCCFPSEPPPPRDAITAASTGTLTGQDCNVREAPLTRRLALGEMEMPSLFLV